MPEIPQIRILDLPGAPITGQKDLPLEQKDVAFSDQERDDNSLLQEATQNRRLSEAFIGSRGLVGQWALTEIMLRAYVAPEKWKGSEQFRSALGIPLLAESFYSLLASVQQNLFGGNKTFALDPGPSTKMDTAAANEALVTAQLKTCGPNGVSGKQEFRAIAFDGLLYGTGVGIGGWRTRTIKKIKKRRINVDSSVPTGPGSVTIHANEDDVEEYVDVREINEPFIEHVPLKTVRCAPDCRRGDIRTASWRGRIIYLNSYQLDELRDVEGYNIPTREELIALTTPQKEATSQNVIDTGGQGGVSSPLRSNTTPQQAIPHAQVDAVTVDPLAKDFEIFEYITDDRIAWILEDQKCIRNSTNDNDIIMMSFNFREAPDSFFGFGLGYWLTDFQRIAQGITNVFFDDLNLNLMGTYTSEKGLNNSAQSAWIFPGKVFKSDNKDGFKPLTRNAVGNDPLAIVEQVKSWAASISGAGAGIQGANPGKPGDMRTGAGVHLLSSGEGTKMADLIDQICEQVLVPFLAFVIEHNSRLKPSQLRQMLSDNLGEAFKGDPLDIINGSYKISISAAGRLAARQSLNQFLGVFESLLQSPMINQQLNVAAMKVDVKAFISAFFQATGFPYEAQIIVSMTDEDKQRLAQQNQANKIEDELTLLKAKGDVKKSTDDNQAENRALLRTQEKMFEHSDRAVFPSTTPQQ